MSAATYQVAIPSHQRPARLAETTLPLLLAGGVPADRITVFVSEAEQHADYAAATAGTGVRIISGHGRGMREARNTIADHYTPGTQLIQIDDDILEMLTTTGPKDLEPLTDVHGFFQTAATTTDGHLWCVYPVANPYFMKPDRIRRGQLWYAEGCLFGYTVTGHTQTEHVTADDKEDFERSCRFYLRDGEVVRFDGITFRSKFYTEPGGMQDYRTPDTIKHGTRQVETLFPYLARSHYKNGRWELRLKDARK